MSAREEIRGAILVTGATGNVGRQVVSRLRHAGAVVRAMTRNPNSAKLPEDVEVVRADLTDAGTLDAALNGVESVFLVWPFITAEAAPAVLDVVSEHTRRVVYLSSMSVRDDVEEQADPISAFHADMERLIEESGPE